MKALVCEMCNSNDVVKQDDYFVCQSCGTKYSVEEARKIMLEGSTLIDEMSKFEHYYKMAKSAGEWMDNKEAEEYSNKILDIAPNNYKALFLKGKAVGRQSSLANLRIDESISYFTKAIENVTGEQQIEIKSEIHSEIEHLSLTVVQMFMKNFRKYTSKYEYEIIKNRIIPFLLKFCSIIETCSGSLCSKIYNHTMIKQIFNEAADTYYRKVRVDYINGHYGKIAFENFYEQSEYVKAVLTSILELCDDCNECTDMKESCYTIFANIEGFLYNLNYVTNDNRIIYLSENEREKRYNYAMMWHQKIKRNQSKLCYSTNH